MVLAFPPKNVRRPSVPLRLSMYARATPPSSSKNTRTMTAINQGCFGSNFPPEDAIFYKISTKKNWLCVAVNV